MHIQINKNISLVEYEPKNIKTVYQIRNHPEIRKGLLEKSAIPYKDHVSWIKNNILNKKRVTILIIYYKKKPIGLSIIKEINKRSLEFELMIVNSRKYPLLAGLVIVATAEIIFNFHKKIQFYSYVNTANIPSLKLLNGLGALKIITDNKNLLKYSWKKSNLHKNKTYLALLAKIKNNSVRNSLFS